MALAFLALLGTGTHTVTHGETLSGIAARYGTTTGALARTNGLANPNHLEAGAQLVVPVAASPATPATPATALYTVRRGDSLSRIAAAHDTTVAVLLARNGLINPDLIRIGQVLELPIAATPARPSAPGAAPGPAGAVSVVTPRAPAGGATTHVVRAGDTIGGIARTYRIPQAQLIDANGLTDERIYLGQRLRLLPVEEQGIGVDDAAPATHVVERGQTLSDIAQRYGITLGALREANRITNPDLISIGRTLSIPRTGAATGSLVCPIRGAMRHMNDWGFPRSGGRFHEGNDLFAARGTPVVAVTSGRAIQTIGRIGGMQVKLQGDDGVTYYYTHLDGFGTAGIVAAGAVIGTVGTSGNAAGGPPHVHFEAHPAGGAAINPYPRLAAAC